MFPHLHLETTRSPHPTHSFVAWRMQANHWMSNHPLEAYVKIVLIGFAYDLCTALHLSEYLAPGLTTSPQGAAIIQNGERVWATYHMADPDSDIFSELGKSFEDRHTKLILNEMLGQAIYKVIPMKPLITFVHNEYT